MIVADETRDIPNEDIVPPPPVDLAARRNGKRSELPHCDIDAERAVLSAVLCFDDALEPAIAAGLAAEQFTGPGHADIWRAICDVHAHGFRPDVVTVADQAATNHATGVTGTALVELQATPLAYQSNVAGYARIIVKHATVRAAMSALSGASELIRLGAEPLATITSIVDRLPVPVAHVGAYTDLDVFLDVDEPDHDWIIPGLLETADRVIITADAGTGKSTLLRQIGVMCAGGLHPFGVVDIDPVNVLLLDVENSERQVRREIRPLRDLIGSRYQPDRFTVRVFGEAINIADPSTLADLCRAVDTHQPGIILCGPLYKLIAGSPIDEEPARAVADAFDKLRHVCGSALIIEAHTPYASGSKKRELRPYGASLWERWPEYGFHFDPAGAVNHWRGQREQRAWPDALERSHPWPWAPRTIDRVDGDTWHGPTKCVEAVIAYLGDHPDEELSGAQLYQRLRADNPNAGGFREKTVRDAAEQAAHHHKIRVRNGARNARYFAAKTGTNLAPGDDGGMF